MPLDPDARAAAEVAWRAYNDSPMQRRLRAAAPCLLGAVYWSPQRVSGEELRYELGRIRATGFTFVRFHAIDPVELEDGRWDFSYADQRMDLAHEVGLQVYPHFDLEHPSRRQLAREGVDPDAATDLGLADVRVAAALRYRLQAVVGRYKDHPALAAWPLKGEPSATGTALRGDIDRRRFRAWLEERYPDPAAVHRAWLIYPAVDDDMGVDFGHRPLAVATWDDAVAIAGRISDEADGPGIAITDMKRHEFFGATRDLIRFRADCEIDDARRLVAMIHELDDVHPVCYGQHQLFYNNGQFGWDQLAFARTADCHYTSIHPSWHFEASTGELDRPHYMQARLTADAFKGGYTNAYETTGGPVQYSGGYGNHMDPALMRKFLCSYLAAGNEGSALWVWNSRPGGIEAGEYALTTLSGRVASWAEAAGAVGRAMDRHRHEIWQATDESELAIVRSWDTETVMTCEPRRHDLEDGPTLWSRGPGQQHIRALIGASRIAIDDQIAYAYLSTDEILAGLAGVYPTIYLPHLRCVADEVLEALIDYVRAGGQVVADVQVGFEDQWGKVRPQGVGTVVERLFGAWIDVIHDSATRPLAVDGVDIDGFVGDLVPTTARILRRFDDGRPAMSERCLGHGRASLLAFDAARSCWRPGNLALQALVADCLRSEEPRRWRSDLAMTFRRRAADADHYFLLNDGPARSVLLRVYDRRYGCIEDVLGGTAYQAQGSIAVDVEAYGAAWLRCVPAESDP